MKPDERVRRLVQSGAVDAAEGERLLAAIAREPARGGWWLLLDPFERFGGGVAAAVGLAIAIASLFASLLNLHFDGFLDAHVSPNTFAAAAREQVAAWLIPALCFWGYARAMSPGVRLIDFFGMVGLARAPLLVTSVPIALLMRDVTHVGERSPRMLAVYLFALVSLGWTLTLLYRGFRNASGLAGVKLVAGFVGTAFAAEVLSKLFLSLF
jgi:hypothetical protein